MIATTFPLLNRTLIHLALAGLLGGIPAARAVTLSGNAADADIGYNATYNIGVGPETSANLLTVGTNGGFTYASFFVFALPAEPSGELVVSAHLTLAESSVSNYSAPLDLYGLGYRSNPTLTQADYYSSATLDPTDAAYLGNSYLPAQPITVSGTVSPTFSTFAPTAAGDQATASYLNAQYGAGAGAGSYVIFRLNAPGVPPNLSFDQFSSSDFAAVTGFANLAPLLTVDFAPVPEPGSAGAVAAASIALAAGVRRRAIRRAHRHRR